jgi:hypothetical protein
VVVWSIDHFRCTILLSSIEANFLHKQPETTVIPAKTELFSRNNRRRLDSPAAITRELGKIYRAAASGKIESGEAMRLSMILRELRNAMEAQAAVQTFDNPLSVINFSVFSVPPGTQIAEDGWTLIWPDGSTPTSTSMELVPYQASEDWTLSPSAPPPMPFEGAPLPVLEMDEPANITRLDRFKAKRDGEPG